VPGQVAEVRVEQPGARSQVAGLEQRDDIANSENARMSSLARAMSANTSASDSTRVP
jgi:hypothetical protein